MQQAVKKKKQKPLSSTIEFYRNKYIKKFGIWKCFPAPIPLICDSNPRESSLALSTYSALGEEKK